MHAEHPQLPPQGTSKGALYFRAALRMRPSTYGPHCHVTAEAPYTASPRSGKNRGGMKAEMRVKAFFWELPFLVLTGL